MNRNVCLNCILQKVVRESFPRLRTRINTISWGATDDLLSYTADPERYAITVNIRLRGARRAVLEGGIAHELCHIESETKLGIYLRQLAWDRYSDSRWYRMREERSVESRAIELGYGNQLLELIRFARRLGYSFKREHGLLYGEILRAERIRAAR